MGGTWPDEPDRGWTTARADVYRLPTMRAVIGDRRVDAFLGVLRDSSPPQALVGHDLRIADRDALAALLRERGLAPPEAARVSADARWGVVLEPGGDGGSRLGASPVLPVGTPWPSAGGRPLTHLGTIDLLELPAVEDPAILPPDGHLSFFADLSEAGALEEPIEPDAPGRDLVAVVHTRPGVPAHEPDPPGGGRRRSRSPTAEYVS